MDIETYTASENDSVISISIKFDMPVANFLKINHLSEDSIIYPGMELKIRKGVRKNTETENLQELNLSQAHVVYCSKIGDIKGVFSYNDYIGMFTPDCIKKSYSLLRNSDTTLEMESLDFHQCISYRDIISASLVEYPGFNEDSLQEDQIYLRIILSRTGSESEGIYKNTPKGTMYFRVKTI